MLCQRAFIIKVFVTFILNFSLEKLYQAIYSPAGYDHFLLFCSTLNIFTHCCPTPVSLIISPPLRPSLISGFLSRCSYCFLQCTLIRPLMFLIFNAYYSVIKSLVQILSSRPVCVLLGGKGHISHCCGPRAWLCLTYYRHQKIFARWLYRLLLELHMFSYRKCCKFVFRFQLLI